MRSNYRTGYRTVAFLRKSWWTIPLIEELLGKPDLIMPNPYRADAGAVRLFKNERVTAAEETERFRSTAVKLQQMALRKSIRQFEHIIGLPMDLTAFRLIGTSGDLLVHLAGGKINLQRRADILRQNVLYVVKQMTAFDKVARKHRSTLFTLVALRGLRLVQEPGMQQAAKALFNHQLRVIDNSWIKSHLTQHPTWSCLLTWSGSPSAEIPPPENGSPSTSATTTPTTEAPPAPASPPALDSTPSA